MLEDSEHVVRIFNSLIETTLDSVDGYEKAAELVRNSRFKSLFQERAQARKQLAQELKDEVRSFNGRSPDDGSILGQAHRIFVELRDKIAGQSDRSVIEEVERGENFIRDRFQKASQDDALPAQPRQLIVAVVVKGLDVGLIVGKIGPPRIRHFSGVHPLRGQCLLLNQLVEIVRVRIRVRRGFRFAMPVASTQEQQNG